MMQRREITKPLWLFLSREGGCWTTRELARSLVLDVTQVCSALRQMFDRGMVKRHVPTEYGKTMAYEVDRHCRIPDNVTLDEVAPFFKGVAP
jgi:predicted transcriptional regulator